MTMHVSTYTTLGSELAVVAVVYKIWYWLLAQAWQHWPLHEEAFELGEGTFYCSFKLKQKVAASLSKLRRLPNSHKVRQVTQRHLSNRQNSRILRYVLAGHWFSESAKNCGWDISKLCWCPFHEQGVLTAAHLISLQGRVRSDSVKIASLLMPIPTPFLEQFSESVWSLRIHVIHAVMYMSLLRMLTGLSWLCSSRKATWLPHRKSTLHTLHSTRYTLHSTHYTSHPTLYNPHSTLDTLHTLDFTLYTPHYTLHTWHSTLYCTLHPLHSTLYNLRRLWELLSNEFTYSLRSWHKHTHTQSVSHTHTAHVWVYFTWMHQIMLQSSDLNQRKKPPADWCWLSHKIWWSQTNRQHDQVHTTRRFSVDGCMTCIMIAIYFDLAFSSFWLVIWKLSAVHYCCLPCWLRHATVILRVNAEVVVGVALTSKVFCISLTLQYWYIQIIIVSVILISSPWSSVHES